MSFSSAVLRRSLSFVADSRCAARRCLAARAGARRIAAVSMGSAGHRQAASSDASSCSHPQFKYATAVPAGGPSNRPYTLYSGAPTCSRRVCCLRAGWLRQFSTSSDDASASAKGTNTDATAAPPEFAEASAATTGVPSVTTLIMNHAVWQGYCACLAAYPLMTKIATAAVCTIIGDTLAQVLERSASKRAGETVKSHDFARLLRLLAYVSVVGTPLAHVWYQFLDAAIMPHNPISPLAILSKVALDQVFWAPLGTILFFACSKLLEGGSLADGLALVKSKLRSALLANYMLWPIAHVINFAFVPPEQRILYIYVINIAWTAYLSNAANSKSNGKASGPLVDGGLRRAQYQS